MEGPIAADYHGVYNKFSEIRGKADFIITGTGWDEPDLVFMDGIVNDIPIFFNPMASKDIKNAADVASHKAKIINKAGVVKYYENEPDQVQMLRILCPKCKVIQVGKGEGITK